MRLAPVFPYHRHCRYDHLTPNTSTLSHLLLVQAIEGKRKERNRIDRTEKNRFPNSGPLHKLLPLLGMYLSCSLIHLHPELKWLVPQGAISTPTWTDTLCSRDTCYLHPSTRCTFRWHSIQPSSTRGGALQGWPSSGPVVKGSDYTCLTEGNCWLYWLCSREDELIHHTITSAKIIKNNYVKFKNKIKFNKNKKIKLSRTKQTIYNENFQCSQAVGRQAPRALLAEA